jgi:hypothetical protein
MSAGGGYFVHGGLVEIGLSDAVAALRDELLSAAASGVGSDIEFEVGPIELEFAVELKADGKAKLGFKAWVISGDVEAGGSRANTHRVKLTLTPRGPEGADILVASRRVIDGAEAGPGDVSRFQGRF